MKTQRTFVITSLPTTNFLKLINGHDDKAYLLIAKLSAAAILFKLSSFMYTLLFYSPDISPYICLVFDK